MSYRFGLAQISWPNYRVYTYMHTSSFATSSCQSRLGKFTFATYIFTEHLQRLTLKWRKLSVYLNAVKCPSAIFDRQPWQASRHSKTTAQCRCMHSTCVRNIYQQIKLFTSADPNSLDKPRTVYMYPIRIGCYEIVGDIYNYATEQRCTWIRVHDVKHADVVYVYWQNWWTGDN